MPRTMLKNPYAEASVILFGERGERNMKFLARKSSIPYATCIRYQNEVEKIPLERFAWVCESSNLSDEDIVRVIKKFFRG